MKRIIILVIDSFGIGAAPDADKFGDSGANTLRHVAERCSKHQADSAGIREGSLKIPHMVRLGLNAAATQCNGQPLPDIQDSTTHDGAYGFASEMSYAKDTSCGHWEMMGVPVLFDWGYFANASPCFPKKLTDDFVEKAGLPGILGNKHASGTTIINEFGDESIKTGKPIVYTSADSVFQIAAHEKHFGLERLYEICEIARQLVTSYNIARVIARPFTGANGQYSRTQNRRDYSLPPPQETLLDKLVAAGGTVIGIGKIPDIFAHRGITKENHAHGDMEIFDATLQELATAPDRSFIFSNFVDCDMLYGHRRDVVGYARALELFDARIPELRKMLHPGDIVIITADHGCDPTYKGTDHTREYVPILMFGPKIKPRDLGHRDTFADIGQSLATYFNLEPFKHGTSFL